MYYGVLLSEWMRKYICLTTLSISIEIIIIGDGEIKSLMYRRVATWFPCQTLYLFNYIHRDCFVSVAYYINWITLSVVLGSLLYGLQAIYIDAAGRYCWMCSLMVAVAFATGSSSFFTNSAAKLRANFESSPL